MRVLICDDEASIRLLFRSAVEEFGAEVLEAADGTECLAVAERDPVDVIVLDIFMPVRDGLDVLPVLRQRCPRTQVFMVSAHASDETFAHSRRRGATRCFDKLAFLDHVAELFGPATP
jgi:CheY-like chemotaxis protein